MVGTGSVDEAGGQAPCPDRIGPYRIVRELGRGGMGIVYLAEQERPVQRCVALKVIQPTGRREGDSFVSRFRAEYQTLARMRHPNIAQVFDAGESQQGHPYFAMELLEGEEITEACNHRRLALRERLQLFIEVCHGVQHAHQRRIIHRDLKPSNVLAVADGDRLIPKIIDFGVAKEVDADEALTVKGELLGSPSYMSPEQLQSGASDVDSRTDVYSLGAILYELLIDRPPFKRREESFVQYLVRVAQEEPPAPSRRFAAEEERQAIAERRGCDAEGLLRALRGDLEWIVMKAMSKDCSQRYATVSELAEDVARHLRHEPVTASPLGGWYRFGKLVRRHRAICSMATVLVLALIAATITTSVSLVRAVRSEQRARLAAERAGAINHFLESLLSSADPAHDGRDARVIDLVNRQVGSLESALAGQPELEASVRHTLGATYLALGEYQAARQQLETALRHRRRLLGPNAAETLDTRDRLARLLVFTGSFDEAVALSQETLRRRRAAGSDAGCLASMVVLGDALNKAGQARQAEQILAVALDSYAPVLGSRHPGVLAATTSLAMVVRKLGRYEEAERAFREVLALQEQRLGPDHPESLRVRSSLANVLFRQRRYAEAETLYRQVHQAQVRVLGETHPATLLSANNVANSAYKLGRYQEAETLYRQTIARQQEVLGAEHPEVLVTRNNLGNALRRQGRLREAELVYRDTAAAQERVVGPGHDETIRTTLNLTTVLMSAGGFSEVVEICDGMIAVRPDLPDCTLRRAEALVAAGRLAEAESAFRQLAATEPANIEHRARLASVLLRQCRAGEAVATVEEAVNLVRSVADVDQLETSLRKAVCRQLEPRDLDQVWSTLATARTRLTAGSADETGDNSG